MVTGRTVAEAGPKIGDHLVQDRPDLQDTIAGMTVEPHIIHTTSGRHHLRLDEQDGSRMATDSPTRTIHTPPRHLLLGSGTLYHQFRLPLPMEQGTTRPIRLLGPRHIGHKVVLGWTLTFPATLTVGLPDLETIVGPGSETMFLAETVVIQGMAGHHQEMIESGETSEGSETAIGHRLTGATTLEIGEAREVGVLMIEIEIIGSGCASGTGMCTGGSHESGLLHHAVAS